MTRRLWILALLTLPLTACTAPLHGPEVDLHAIATPDPVPQAVRTVPQPPPGPLPGAGRWRAWVPPQVQPNGDTIEGHWMTVSDTPPPVETVEPAVPMPRAPKVHLGQKPQPKVDAAHQVVPSAIPTPVLPSGLLPQETPGLARTPRLTLPRGLLGGQ